MPQQFIHHLFDLFRLKVEFQLLEKSIGTLRNLWEKSDAVCPTLDHPQKKIFDRNDSPFMDLSGITTISHGGESLYDPNCFFSKPIL